MNLIMILKYFNNKSNKLYKCRRNLNAKNSYFFTTTIEIFKIIIFIKNF